MRKITSLLMLFCMCVGMAWGQIVGVKEIPSTPLDFSSQSLTTGYYLINQTNENAKPVGYLKAASEAANTEVVPNGAPTAGATDQATYIWYVEVANDGKFSIATANKVAGWQAPTQKQKNLVAYENRATTLELETTFNSLSRSTQTLVKAWWNDQNCYSYVHDSGDKLGSWNDQNTASLYYLEFYPIPEGHLNIYDAKSDLRNKVAEVTKNLGKVKLQTTNAEGAFYLSATTQGDAPISKAIDGDPTTYYGSIWGGSVGHPHYWQVDVADASNLAEFIFSYTTRENGKDVPTTINVQGSTNGTDFENIVVLSEGLPTGGGETYTSASIINNGYRYIRFEVTSVTNGYSPAAGEYTIAIAEFSLKNADVTAYQEAYDALVAAQAVLDNASATEADVATALHNLKMATIEVPEYPFTITTDDTHPVCYAIKSGRTNDDKTWWYTYTEDGKIKLTQYTEADNQLWYFKHVKTNDYKYALQLFPKLGEGKVMSYQNTSNDPDKIVAQPLNTDDWTNYWTLVTTDGTEPYGFQTYDGKNYLSNNGGVGNNMGMWNASPSADGGTAMYFVNPAETSALLKTEFEAWMAARPTGTGLGEYGRDEAAFEEAKASYEAATNFIDLSAAIDACKATYGGLNMPTPGKFYRVYSMNANDDAKKGKYWQVNETGDGMELQKGANYSKLRSIVCLNGDNNLISFANGMFVNRYYKDKDNAALGLESTTWSFVENLQVPGTYAIKNNVNNYGNFYLADWTGGVTFGYNDANAAWMIEEVEWLPIPVNVEAGWTTLYSPVELELSSNRFKAYTVSDVSETSATLAEQTVVPAGVGVVLEYQDGAEVENGCVFLKVKATETTGVTSALLGTYADEYISADAYVLGYINVAEEGQPEDKQVGFYTALKNQQEGASWLNNGFKAYLPKTTEAKTLRFNFDGETTAIDAVEVENANAPIYDLSGRRVLTTVKGGIYIQNGKKFIVK